MQTKVYKDLLVYSKNGKNQQRICMKIDTGADSNILPLRKFKKIFPDTSMVNLAKTVRPNTILETAKGDEIKQLGHCKINVCFADNRILCHFFVVPNYCHCILGLPDSERLKILTIHTEVVSDVIQPQSLDAMYTIDDTTVAESNSLKNQILSDARYKVLFSGIGFTRRGEVTDR